MHTMCHQQQNNMWKVFSPFYFGILSNIITQLVAYCYLHLALFFIVFLFYFFCCWTTRWEPLHYNVFHHTMIVLCNSNIQWFIFIISDTLTIPSVRFADHVIATSIFIHFNLTFFTIIKDFQANIQRFSIAPQKCWPLIIFHFYF